MIMIKVVNAGMMNKMSEEDKEKPKDKKHLSIPPIRFNHEGPMTDEGKETLERIINEPFLPKHIIYEPIEAGERKFKFKAELHVENKEILDLFLKPEEIDEIGTEKLKVSKDDTCSYCRIDVNPKYQKVIDKLKLSHPKCSICGLLRHSTQKTLFNVHEKCFVEEINRE